MISEGVLCRSFCLQMEGAAPPPTPRLCYGQPCFFWPSFSNLNVLFDHTVSCLIKVTNFHHLHHFPAVSIIKGVVAVFAVREDYADHVVCK